MRIWDVDPKLLCRKHLLGEHVECHMFAGTILKEKSIQGYIDKGLVNPRLLRIRHNLLAKEIKGRGYNHRSDFPELITSPQDLPFHPIDWEYNIEELKRRCPDCRARILALNKEAAL